MTYKLSQYGRSVTWGTWITLGGCGLPNDTSAYVVLGPLSRWPINMKIGKIEDACPYTGRVLARFAVERLRMPELAEPYERREE